MKTLAVIFLTVLVAEIGDKTQLATMLYATDPAVSRVSVFAAAASALILSSLIAVLAGSAISRYISPANLQILAGVGFLAVGLWTLWAAFSGSE